MNLYLDTSVLVPLFSHDRLAARSEQLLRSPKLSLFISDLGSTEFASAIARKMRTGEVSKADAEVAFANYDRWRINLPTMVPASSEDISAAESFIRRLDLNLRAPDAIHIAIALPAGLPLATFDERMAACARDLGLAVAAA